MSDMQDVLAEVKDLSEKVGGFGNLVEAQRKAFADEQAEVKKLGEATAETKAKIEAMETDIVKFEDLNAKMVKIIEAEKERKEAEEEAAKGAKAALEEMGGRIDGIEVALKRAPRGGEDAKAELKQRVNAWARAVVYAHNRGEANLNEDQRKALDDSNAEWKALSVSTDTLGGFLAPVEYAREIIKGVTEISAMRPLVRVRTTGSTSIQVPKRTGQFAAQWVSEQGTRSETEGLTYGLEEIPTHEVYALVDITEQMLEDAFLDMEAEITMEATEQFAVAEGNKVVNGNGVGVPQGFLENSDVASDNSGSAALISDANGQANGLIDLYHNLKTAYARNGTWTLNRKTLGAVRKLKDGDNNYIWVPGLADLRPNTILDAPYVEVPDMPDVAANAFPIAFGDWRRAYILVDRVQMSMLRDPYTQAPAGKIRFIFRKRVGGQVVLAEAIRKLKCST